MSTRPSRLSWAACLLITSNRFGRQWQVYIEAEGDYRTRAENVGQFYVRNNKGGMVPLSALTRFEPRPGPEFTMRFNEYRAAQMNGAAAPGYKRRTGHGRS